ncbi:MAG: heme-binding protein [Planctomycetota bacterium]
MRQQVNGTVWTRFSVGAAIAVAIAFVWSLSAAQAQDTMSTEPGAYAEGAPTRTSESQASVIRLRSETDLEAVLATDGWRAGPFFIDSPLPDGYPAPTPPGALELKVYPSVRRAEIDSIGSSRGGFWPLFQHIQRRNIPMTAPVEMDYEGWTSDSPPERSSMSFLYRSPDEGEAGDDGAIRVYDTETITVISRGFNGSYRITALNDELAEVEAWIEASDEWERDGEPRVFGYNGPGVPRNRMWGEVQIPVRKIIEAGE